jgi:hypothetical protein
LQAAAANDTLSALSPSNLVFLMTNKVAGARIDHRNPGRYNEPFAQGMTRHENITFENQHVILDDGVFVSCTFKNCSLEYSGGDVYVQNCQGESCQLVWRGAAQRTIFLLQGLGLLAPAASLPTSESPSRVQ